MQYIVNLLGGRERVPSGSHCCNFDKIFVLNFGLRTYFMPDNLLLVVRKYLRTTAARFVLSSCGGAVLLVEAADGGARPVKVRSNFRHSATTS